MAVSTFLFCDAFARSQQPVGLSDAVAQVGAAAAGALLLIGLWTPIAGILVTLLEIWIALSTGSGFGARLLASAVALALSLIGPGAWSVDALMFGRKRISIQGR